MATGRKCDILWIQYPNADYYPPTINALRVLARSGLTVEVLCCADWPVTGTLYPSGVTVNWLGVKRKRGWAAPLSFLRFVARALRMAVLHRPGVIYGCDLHGIVAAGIVGETLGIPYVHHCYDVSIPEEGMGRVGRMLKPLEIRFSARARCLVFPAESYAQTFLRIARMRRSYLLTANVPLRQPDRRGSALRDVVARSGRNPRFVVHYQGAIGRGKGLETLVRSIPRWPEGAVLTLQGLVRPPEYEGQLMRLARSIGVEDRVVYVGVTSYDDLLDLTRSADLGVFLPTDVTTHNRNAGVANNKVMEYMACGVPSLVAPFPGLKTLMEETGAGVVVDPSDPEAVGREVTAMLTDRNRWNQCSRNARKAHLEKYNFELQFRPVLDALCRLKAA